MTNRASENSLALYFSGELARAGTGIEVGVAPTFEARTGVPQ